MKEKKCFHADQIMPDENAKRSFFFCNYYDENEYTKPDIQYILLGQTKFLL